MARISRGRFRTDASVEQALVWMLGSPRTGSTWLLNLLRVHPGVVGVDEPAIGSHLGLFAADVMGIHPSGFEQAEALLSGIRANDDNYFFAATQLDAWRPALRQLLLGRFRVYMQAGTEHVVIKEPAGSQAAEMLVSILPRSRVLFLMRDGRDVIDSELDAVQKGGWLAQHFGSTQELVGLERMAFITGQAHRWVARTEAVGRAYERLPAERRFLIRYEDLRVDTATWLVQMLDWMGASLDEQRVREHAELLAFEALPMEAKGKSRFARSAQPGLWRENLSAPEHAVMNDVMGPTLTRFGYSVP